MHMMFAIAALQLLVLENLRSSTRDLTQAVIKNLSDLTGYDADALPWHGRASASL